LSLVPKWIVIGLLPQLTLWIAFTVTVGTLFGSLSLFFQKRPEANAPASQDAAVKRLGAHP
jgi:ABC-type polysaccharide/polyol phosphate export permease